MTLFKNPNRLSLLGTLLLAACGAKFSGENTTAFTHVERIPGGSGSGSPDATSNGGTASGTNTNSGNIKTGTGDPAGMISFAMTEEYAYDGTCKVNLITQCTIPGEIPIGTNAPANCTRLPGQLEENTCLPAEFRNKLIALSGPKIYITHFAADATHPNSFYKFYIKLSSGTEHNEELLSLDANTFQRIDNQLAEVIDRI